MKPKWTLELSFSNHMGESYHMAVEVDDSVARDFQSIKPPPRNEFDRMLNPMSFDQVCEVIKTRQFRKDLFVGEAKRLGTLLAERMEDKEGWHGESRAEDTKGLGESMNNDQKDGE